MNAEEKRLEESRLRRVHWKRWGPYVSERQWGTVREDYSPHGNAWEYFPHDLARSRAYRRGCERDRAESTPRHCHADCSPRAPYPTGVRTPTGPTSSTPRRE